MKKLLIVGLVVIVSTFAQAPEVDLDDWLKENWHQNSLNYKKICDAAQILGKEDRSFTAGFAGSLHDCQSASDDDINMNIRLKEHCKNGIAILDLLIPKIVKNAPEEIQLITDLLKMRSNALKFNAHGLMTSDIEQEKKEIKKWNAQRGSNR